MNKSRIFTFVLLLIGALVLVACTPETIEVEVEVTRVVTETETITETVTEEIEVTRIVEGESVTETITEEVEVTRVVEVEAMVDPTACNAAAPAEASEINMIGWAFPVTEFFAAELEKCNDVDNLSVNTQLLDSAGAQEQIQLGLAGGAESPFSIIHTTPASIAEHASQGTLHPLNDLVEQYWIEYNLFEIPQSAWDAVTYEGNIYGVPFLANTLHMFYRTDLFEQYELSPPTSYDGVIEACNVLADEPSIDIPFTMNLHAGWAWEIEFLHFLRSFEGHYLNDDNTPAWNSEEGVAALNQMKAVIDACMGQEGLTYSIDDSEIGMETGGLAFVNIWASRAANMDDPEKSDFVGIIGFAPAAAPMTGGLLGGSSFLDAYTIPANISVDHEVAFQVILEATDFQSQLEGADLGIVTRTSVADAGAGGRYLAAVSETVADGVGAPLPIPARALAASALGNWLPLVGTGEMTPAEALQAAADEYLSEAIAQGFVTE